MPAHADVTGIGTQTGGLELEELERLAQEEEDASLLAEVEDILKLKKLVDAAKASGSDKVEIDKNEFSSGFFDGVQLDEYESVTDTTEPQLAPQPVSISQPAPAPAPEPYVAAIPQAAQPVAEPYVAAIPQAAQPAAAPVPEPYVAAIPQAAQPAPAAVPQPAPAPAPEPFVAAIPQAVQPAPAAVPQPAPAPAPEPPKPSPKPEPPASKAAPRFFPWMTFRQLPLSKYLISNHRDSAPKTTRTRLSIISRAVVS